MPVFGVTGWALPVPVTPSVRYRRSTALHGGVGGSAFLGQQLGGGKGYVEQLGEDTQALRDAISKGR